MRPKMAMNAAQHKIINLLKNFSLLISFCQCLCVSCVAQENSSSSRVARRRQKIGHPCEGVWNKHLCTWRGIAERYRQGFFSFFVLVFCLFVFDFRFQPHFRFLCPHQEHFQIVRYMPLGNLTCITLRMHFLAALPTPSSSSCQLPNQALKSST